MHIWRVAMKGNYPPNCITVMAELLRSQTWLERPLPTPLETKDMSLKLTSYKNVGISVGWNGNENFVVFQGAKQEAAALNKNFKHCCIVAPSTNGCMNGELILLYLKRVIGFFSFQMKLLAGDSFEAYMTGPAQILWRKWELMILLFEVDAINTSRHLMYFGIISLQAEFWNFMMNG